MAEERERSKRGEKERFLDSDDECDVDNDGPVPRSNMKRRGTTDETLVVPFNNEDNENDAPSHLGKTDGGGGGASYSGRADGDCDAAEPDDGEIPGTCPFLFFSHSKIGDSSLRKWTQSFVNHASTYDFVRSKKISNDQELIQSDPTSCPQNQKGNN